MTSAPSGVSGAITIAMGAGAGAAAGVAGAATLCGLSSVGGLLVDWFGWRSIFFMVVPFCLASIALAYKFVPTTAPGGVPADRRGEPLDWRGLMLGTLGTLCLLNGLVAMHSGPYAQAAARALLEHTALTPEQIVRQSLTIAGELCIYTNLNHTIETLE